jgi:hypothetical protein
MGAPGTTQPQFGMQQPRVRRSKFGGNQGFNFGQFTGQQGNMQTQGFATGPQGGTQPRYTPGNQMPTRAEMEPFLGSAGKVKYDPMTGRKVPQAQRLTPNQYRNMVGTDISYNLATGPALQEASNFQFQNLPPSIMQQGGAYDQLMGASQNVMGGYNANMQKGQGLLDQATQGILGTQTKMGAGAENAAGAQEQARAELQNLQRQALSPDLDPMQRAFFQQRADERLSEIGNMESNLMDAFQRQQASDVADLAARGVLDSTTASNVMGERGRRLGLDMNTLRQQAGELSRQELGKERERIGQTAGQFGGLQGSQAATQGGLMAQLLGSQGTLGAQLGGLGTQQQGVAAELAKMGISGLGMGGELGLKGREQELQQAELSTRMLGDQTQLQNIQSLLNQMLGRKATRQGMNIQQQLFDQYNNQGGIDWGALLGGAAGFALGGPTGAAAGYGIGKSF